MHRVVHEEVHHPTKQNFMQPITSEEEQAMQIISDIEPQVDSSVN
ncbi:MAG: hypothetical protein ACK521_11480 [bacterium]